MNFEHDAQFTNETGLLPKDSIQEYLLWLQLKRLDELLVEVKSLNHTLTNNSH